MSAAAHSAGARPATALAAAIEGVGYWSRGLPDWNAARAYALGGEAAPDAPARPSPQLLPANERRRAPETVAVALDVAAAACAAAGRDPAALSSVFASSHGDMAITDYMCATLAADPRAISPTRFHNSVHNAAAGYWTIGVGAMRPATALSALEASFAQGLIDALAQLAAGEAAVLLAGYDGAGYGPLGAAVPSEGLLGAALVLGRAPRAGAPRLHAWLGDPPAAPAAPGRLLQRDAGNASAPMLPLFDALATGAVPRIALPAGSGRSLWLELDHD
ncbi:beta-ketoacyl synthase chain length factor [Lysobacter yananisis]|uniref:Beta-ketoacyl synthase chain length factor n=1 Tax=Lysobacter yananisis TaxID=1003114 RepID=A0ABY9PCV8_9GAMM|nr:beta-ketoacyl synthase chain length factor [Lysobacter yananisis]WMT04877.1 beta-ketoacyl synthase chain length factor [Lysobacter yananisis]